MPVRVLLVDDEPMVCAHLRTILGADDGIEVVGEALDGAEAMDLAVRHRPDVVLLDLRMPGVDGFAALDRLLDQPAPPRVVVLTTVDADDAVLRALGAGASGFLLKSTAPADLIRLVEVAAAGHTVLSPESSERLVRVAAGGEEVRARAAARLAVLSPREGDVLAGVGDGLSNAAIGGRLHLSEATVKGYVSRLLVKLDCENRTQVGLLAHAAAPPRPGDPAGGAPAQ